IRRAAAALYAPTPDRRDEFEALFQAHFMGRTLAAEAEEGDEDELQAQDASAADAEVLEGEEAEGGGEATPAEALNLRRFAASPDAALARLAREAPARLPRRPSRRRRSARTGQGLDMRRALRKAAARDGELFELPRLRRRSQGRRLLLLIDVSGSMKPQTEGALRMAHALTRAAERIEVFTLGTRLTRVTPALRLRRAEAALEQAAGLVADWDGGTRLGDALQAFLAVPRFAGFARGAATMILSDGLERGGPEAMVDAARRLSRLAWRLDWLTPLALDERFAPRTAALAAAAPYIDRFAPGGSVEALCAHALSLAEDRRP
ncbi:MAG: VWA domain-containing protein, partial [Pseudomonadota bacterium]